MLYCILIDCYIIYVFIVKNILIKEFWFVDEAHVNLSLLVLFIFNIIHAENTSLHNEK